MVGGGGDRERFIHHLAIHLTTPRWIEFWEPTTMPKSTTTRTTSQTVRIAGVRTKITTRNGRVTATAALPLEWECQAAQVKALRAMPEYGAPPQGQFLLAADMNAERRGPKARVIAIASGMTAGEPDLRIYLAKAGLRMIENKVGRGPLSPAQIDRHAALAKLGHHVTVLRFTTTEDAAAQAVALVRGWLVANEGGQEGGASARSASPR